MFIWNRFVPAVVGLRFLHILRATWRSILSGGVMVAAVALMMSVFPVSAHFPALVRFVTIALAGGAVLLLVQYALWMACGRPQSPESMLLGLATKIWQRLRSGVSVSLGR